MNKYGWLLLFISFSVFAQEVRELEFGSCWVQSNKQKIKLASFSEGYALGFQKDQLEESVISLVKSEGFYQGKISRIDLTYHCSSSQTFILAKLSGMTDTCAHFKLDSKEGLVFMGLYSNPDSKGKVCLGVVPKELLFFEKKDSSSLSKDLAKEYILSKYSKFIDEVIWDDLFIKLKLKENYSFKEKEIKQTLQADTFLNSLGSFEYNRIYIPTGTFYPLNY